MRPLLSLSLFWKNIFFLFWSITIFLEINDCILLCFALVPPSKLPPIVQPEEIDKLKVCTPSHFCSCPSFSSLKIFTQTWPSSFPQAQLAEVAHGRRFILQGGDCAERFVDCTKDRIEAKLKILLQMSLVLVWGARVPLVRIGRIAGQYMKPRSQPKEKVNGEEVFAYKVGLWACFSVGCSLLSTVQSTIPNLFFFLPPLLSHV